MKKRTKIILCLLLLITGIAAVFLSVSVYKNNKNMEVMNKSCPKLSDYPDVSEAEKIKDFNDIQTISCFDGSSSVFTEFKLTLKDNVYIMEGRKFNCGREKVSSAEIPKEKVTELMKKEEQLNADYYKDYYDYSTEQEGGSFSQYYCTDSDENTYYFIVTKDTLDFFESFTDLPEEF